MESEFIALDKAAEEAEWLRNFLEDIPMWEKPVPALRVHCDSQSAIARALSNLYNGKSRHIRRRHKTIRHLVSTGVITIDYIRSADNLADPFTKGLSRDQVEKSSKGMGLKPRKKDEVWWKPHLPEWRSHEVGSKGELNQTESKKSTVRLASLAQFLR
uniref:Retrovirus-related Pol polyprotein from transposon TNT 1-94 n=1 Tax=Noccaea caerulescens TaxID=107243 RepID=A0A1J3J004_NOCCA